MRTVDAHGGASIRMRRWRRRQRAQPGHTSRDLSDHRDSDFRHAIAIHNGNVGRFRSLAGAVATIVTRRKCASAVMAVRLIILSANKLGDGLNVGSPTANEAIAFL